MTTANNFFYGERGWYKGATENAGVDYAGVDSSSKMLNTQRNGEKRNVKLIYCKIYFNFHHFHQK